MFNDSTYPFNFMTTGDGVDSDLVIPDSFGQCLSYEQQIAFILKLIDDIDGGVVIPEITADATVDQSTGTPSVTVVKTGDDEAPVFTFNFHNIKGETGEHGEKGDTGETGATGRPGNDGADGVSPTVTTTQIANGYRITITDADGSHVFDIYNGNDGETGPAGYSPTVTVQTITGGHSITITDEDGDHTFNVLDGLNGADGSDGSDGVSPVITSTAIAGGHRITIVDAQGTTNVDVMDGATGATGNGIASTVLNQDYTLTITYTDGTTYTTPSIRGAQGATGQNGTDGISPTVTVTDHTNYHHIEITSAGGTEQFDVYNGTDGSDGTDGVSPTVSTTAITDGTRVTITDAQGSHTFDVMNGTDGTDGTDGSDGQDGAAATIQVGTVTTGAAGTNASVTNSGTSSAAVFDFTIPRGADGQNGQTGPAGPGVASGGTAGQVLAKASGTDYDTEWINPPSGGDDLTLVARFVKWNSDRIRIYKDSDNNPIFWYTPYGIGLVYNENGGFGYNKTVAEIFTALLTIYSIEDDNLGYFAVYDGSDNQISTLSALITLLTTNFPTIPKLFQLSHLLIANTDLKHFNVTVEPNSINISTFLSDGESGFITMYQQCLM